jgi:CheY-like chemotaxis protein
VTDNPAVLLVVDDDAAKRYLTGAWLRRAGFGPREDDVAMIALRAGLTP